MNSVFLYALTGLGLFTLGLYALIIQNHLLRKILAINVMGSGVFLVLIALADRTQTALFKVAPDPVPHAMVITGIVVAVSATALGLTLMLRVLAETGQAAFPEELIDEHPEAFSKERVK